MERGGQDLELLVALGCQEQQHPPTRGWPHACFLAGASLGHSVPGATSPRRWLEALCQK